MLRSFKIVKETTMNKTPEEQHHRSLHPREERDRVVLKIIKHYVYLHHKIEFASAMPGRGQISFESIPLQKI